MRREVDSADPNTNPSIPMLIDPLVGDDPPFISDEDYRWEGEVIHAFQVGDTTRVRQLLRDAPGSEYGRLLVAEQAESLLHDEPLLLPPRAIAATLDDLNVTDRYEAGEPIQIERAEGEAPLDYACRIFTSIHRRLPTLEERNEMAEELAKR
jgi:hypothetical protein